MMTLKNCPPLNILLAVDGSDHARAAVQLFIRNEGKNNYDYS
jgi:hypothetical protein